MRCWPRYCGLLLLLLLSLPVPAVAQLGNELARQQLIRVLSDSTGLTVRVGALEGSLLTSLSAENVQFSDSEGPVLDIGSVRLDWVPKQLIKRELQITNLQLGDVRLRRPFSLTEASAEPIVEVATNDQPLEPLPPRESYDLFGIDLPRLPVTIRVQRFDLERLQIDPPMLTRADLTDPVLLRAAGSLVIPHTDQPIELATEVRRLDAVQGEIRGRFAYQPSSRQLNLSTLFSEGPGGLFQRLTPIDDDRAVAFSLTGEGPVDRWRGKTEFLVDRLVQVQGDVGFTEEPGSGDQRLDTRVVARFGSDLRQKYPGLFDDLAQLDLRARYVGQRTVFLDAFDIQAPAIRATGKGNLDVVSQLYDFDFELLSRDLSPLAQLVGVPLTGAGDLQVTAQQTNDASQISVKGLVEDFQLTGVRTPRAQLDVVLDNPPLVSTIAAAQDQPLAFALSLVTRQLGLGPVELVSSERDLDLFVAGQARLAGEDSQLEVPVINLNLPGIEGRGSADLRGARFSEGDARFRLSAPDLTEVKATRDYLSAGAAEIDLRIAGSLAEVRADASGLRWLPGQQASVLGSDLRIDSRIDLTPLAEGEERRLPLTVNGSNLSGEVALQLGDDRRLTGRVAINDLSPVTALADLIDGGGYAGAIDIRFGKDATRVTLDGRGTDLDFNAALLDRLIGAAAPLRLRLVQRENALDFDQISLTGRAIDLDLTGRLAKGEAPLFEGKIAPKPLFDLLDQLPLALAEDAPIDFRFVGGRRRQDPAALRFATQGLTATGGLLRWQPDLGSRFDVVTDWRASPDGVTLTRLDLSSDRALALTASFDPPVTAEQFDGKPGRRARAQLELALPELVRSNAAFDSALPLPLQATLALALDGDALALSGSGRITDGPAAGRFDVGLTLAREAQRLEVTSARYQGELGGFDAQASLTKGQLQTARITLDRLSLAPLKALASGRVSGPLALDAAGQLTAQLTGEELLTAPVNSEEGSRADAGRAVTGIDRAQLTLRLPETRQRLLVAAEGDRRSVLAQRVGAQPMVGSLGLSGLRRIPAAPSDASPQEQLSAGQIAFEGLGDRLAVTFALQGRRPDQPAGESGSPPQPLAAQGAMRIEGLATWLLASQDGQRGRINAELSRLTVQASPGGPALSLSAPARLEIDAQRQRLSLPGLVGGGIALRLEGEVADGQVRGEAALEVPDIAALPGLSGFSQRVGRAQARLSLAGPARNPGAIGDFSVSGLNLTRRLANNPRGGQLPPLTVGGTLRLSGGSLLVDGRASGPRDLRADLQLAVPVRADFERFDLGLDDSRPLAGRVTGILRLIELAEYLDLDGDTLEGTLRFDSSIAGSLRRPTLDGQFSLSDGRYESFRAGIVVENLDLVGQADGRALRFQSVPGSSIATNGSVRLGEAEGLPLDMALSFTRQNLLARDDLTAIMTGNLAISGLIGQQLTVTGDVQVDNAEFSLAASGLSELPDLEVIEINRANQPLPFTRAARPASNIFTDISIRAADNIIFRGGGVNTRWNAALRMQGPVNKPFLTGSITNADGRLTVLGNEFFVTRGVVSYSQDPIAEPRLDLQAERQAGDLLVLLTLSGTASNPAIELSSVPELPADEILAGLLFGADINDLTGVQAAELAIALLRLQSIGRSDDLIERVRTLASLDQLTLSADENDVTRLRAGKRIGDPLLLWAEQGLELDSGRIGARVDVLPGVNGEASYGVDGDAQLRLNWSQNF